MRFKVIFILILVASSCTTSNLVGTYNRTYKVSTAAMTSIKKQKLIINPDSSFMWIDYKNKFSKGDSSLTYGIIKNTKGNKLYILIDTVVNNKFCVFKKGIKLYFYNCDYGKRYRYSNPFIKYKLPVVQE